MVDHPYGGSWTEVKIALLKSYMQFFTTSLGKNSFFDLIYIDACAGNGERVVHIGDTLKLSAETKLIYDGSAKIALNIEPSFNKYYFIDNDREKISDLEQLKRQHDKKQITILHGDANFHVKEICKNENWKNFRGLLFLDPYGMEIEYETLKIIAETKRIDICYLFPLAGVFRQAANKLANVAPYKQEILKKLFGTDDWQKVYQPKKQISFFDEEQGLERESGSSIFDTFIMERLEHIFPYVSNPIKLPKKGAPFFSFYYAISNPSPKAQNLAKKIISYISKQQF